MTAPPRGRLRIMHVIADLHVGGAETALARLVERWQAEGHDNLVANLTAGGRLRDRVAASGASLVELDLARGRLPGPAAMRLRAARRDFRPDVVQGWMYHGNLAASLARLATLGGAPVLWSVHHSLTGPVWPRRLTRLLIRAGAPLSRTAARVVYCSAVSAAQHERLGYAPARTVVIPNGVDGDLFRPDPAAGARLRALLGGVPPGTRLVGLFARHDPMKDHAALFAATAGLRARGVPLRLVLAGGGVEPANAGLRAAIAHAGLADEDVSLLGERGDVDRLMPGLDAFALPSAYGEAFPLVLIEAMAAGVPCVATDVGDSARVLGETGLVVPTRDPTALAAALERLLTAAPDERARRCEAARRRVMDLYALPAVAERYLQLYGDVLAGRAARGRAPAAAAADEVSACAD